MNNSKKIGIYLFILVIFTVCFGLILSSKGIIPVTHGPLYYYYAEGILEHKKFVDNIFAIPQPITTPQIGITFVHLFGIFFFGKEFSFIFYILIVSILWRLVYNIIINNNLFNNLLYKEKIILFLLIFFQPYNINQISNFSNESVYFPLLILFFFKIIKFIQRNNDNKIIFIRKDIFILIFLFGGAVFRVHHFVFFFSLIVYFFLSKNYKLFFFFLTFLLFTLISYFLFIRNYIPLAFLNIQDFTYNIYRSHFYNSYIAMFDQTDIDHFIQLNDKQIFIKLINATSTFSFFLLLKKFIPDLYYTTLAINFVFLIFYCNGFKSFIKKKIFTKFSIIFLLFTFIFIFLLPIFEYSYLLPTSFLVIINLFYFFRINLSKYFFQITLFLILIYSILLVFIFIFAKNNNKFEVHKYRLDFKYFKLISSKYPKENTLFYFNVSNPTMPEIYKWISNIKACNWEMHVNQCSELQKKNIIKYIIIKVIDDKINSQTYLNTILGSDNLDKYNQTFYETIIVLEKL
jgi:hypothetical protein